jgi:selenide,water dikinase
MEALHFIKLTHYSRGSGCGCKIAPDVLSEILKGNDNRVIPNLLVSNLTNDDAAVLDLENGTALISTTDFFMPIVDDAFLFGKIAAANAISDVYAMGGKPVLAIAILGFPVDKLPIEIASQMMDGAKQICADAGIPLAGGHSIDSVEPIFGLSVNGVVDVAHLKQNNTAQEGDYLFLTKPLGVGIITSAAKKEKVKAEDMKHAIACMTALNKIGEACGKIKGIHAMTDVTGFGLLGHLNEMCQGSNLSAELYFDKLPLLPNLDFYLDQFIYPDMTTKIYAGLSEDASELTAKQLFIGCDPQTSGGLLIAVAPGAVYEFKKLAASFFNDGRCEEPVGRMLKAALRGKRITVL